ncbi:hydantoinase/oxoprolinase family protein [Teichococcus oryzae]|nr:hydantoinase/oxoprolinase family protein [Pseudoroseomonas oryzae]
MEMEIGIDIGGTFTDAVCRQSNGRLRLLKVPSTPDDPARAVGVALSELLGDGDGAAVRRFLHGTTVATNAILEGNTARVALITTTGFGDVIEIGRMIRSVNYDLILTPQTPVGLIPPERRYEVHGRIGADGAVVEPLDEEGVAEAARQLAAEGVQAVAICFLFSFLNPAHERRAREIIEAECPGVAVSLSSDVDPAIREYERTCATAFDAALKPVMDSYLARIEGIIAKRGIRAPLQVMHSRGGLLGSGEARRRPVRLTLSGPSAAAIGAASVLRQAGFSEGISIDVGGTSADVALISGGAAVLRTDGRIGSFPVRVPTADVVAVAAGGGSIAWIDATGALRVGPRSAGADPGPACYRRGGTMPTVLDASVVLGLVDPVSFAGGHVPLDCAAAEEAIEREIAAPLGIGVQEAALAIHRVINAIMAEAVRQVTVARGTDPRDWPLLPAGGGGGLHAATIAEDLGMGCIVVPSAPGVLAAMGLLEAPLEHDASRGYYRPVHQLAEDVLRADIEELAGRCAAAMTREGVEPAMTETEVVAAASFVGQGHTLDVPVPAECWEPGAAIRDGFIAVHRRAYGHTRDAPVRLVELRVVQRARIPGPPSLRAAGAAEARGGRCAVIGGAMVKAVTIPRIGMADGEMIRGPAIVEQADSTLVVPAGWEVTSHPAHLLMRKVSS